MKISCPACTAKYSIADDRVQDRLAKIRCRKCGATIVIDGKASPPHVYTAQGEATDMADHGEAATEYSVDFGEGDQRSMILRDIAKAYNAGTITGETYVWTDGLADWKPLADVPELLEAIQSGPARGASKPSPWDARAASAPRAAARSTRSPTADLFGGIDTAGSEEDVATSAPEHPGPSGPSAGSSSSGARNESSVLFSLSALTSQASTRPSTRPGAAASRDDSGLIDLKALTAAAMKSDAGAAPAAPAMPAVSPLSPLGMAPPLGLSSPLGGGITATTDIGIGYPQPKSKAPLFIGGGLAIGLIAIAFALVLRPDPPPPPPAPIVAAPPPPAPAPTPTPTQQEAKPPATGAGEEEDPPSTSKTPARPRRVSAGSAPKKSGGDTSTTTAPAPKAAPAKKTGGCGCASGDLQCAMRCAAKGG